MRGEKGGRKVGAEGRKEDDLGEEEAEEEEEEGTKLDAAAAE